MMGAWVRHVLIIFLLGAACSGCANQFDSLAYGPISVSELKRLENLDAETLYGEVNGKKALLEGSASLYGFQQLFLLGDLDTRYEKGLYPVFFNCIQMLIPDRILRKFPIGKVEGYRFYGAFLIVGDPFYDVGQPPKRYVAFYEIDGVKVEPYCAQKNGLFFKVEKIESDEK